MFAMKSAKLIMLIPNAVSFSHNFFNSFFCRVDKTLDCVVEGTIRKLLKNSFHLSKCKSLLFSLTELVLQLPSILKQEDHDGPISLT